MATRFDETGSKRGTVVTQNPEALMGRDGVSDLAALALAELASGPREAELSAEAMAALPNPHVSAMARAMANADSDEAEALVSDLLDAGLTVRELCLSYFTPAARELGRLWDCDKLPFTEVSMATARMHAILRNLPGGVAASLTGNVKEALFVATPGETHTLGVLMAADHFRRLGWDVSALVGLGHDALVRQILSDDRPVLGISCSGSLTMDTLSRLVADVQARRPNLAIVLAGAVTQDPLAMAQLPECDGIIEGLETAETDIQAALDCAKSRQQQPQISATG
ncbi:B12-binding domain-containing protein [Gymnodinialimonas hymeniacidonis]|uniref:cobalamin B12-binding domain-containing protein n=1 Tax=Gymnodinialimonas hymeniacidonis TaxID=3126508 RepID=UPI0034C67011